MPPIDQAAWLLGQGDINFAEWLVRMTITPECGFRNLPGPSAPRHTHKSQKVGQQSLPHGLQSTIPAKAHSANVNFKYNRENKT